MIDSISSFKKRQVFVLKETNTVAEAAQAMAEHNSGCVIVADGLGHVCGLLTDRDLACEVLAHKEDFDTPLQEIITRSLLAIKEDDSLKDAIAIMKKSGVRRVPILKIEKSGRHRCTGLITLDDLIKRKLIRIDDAAQIIKKSVHLRQFQNSRNDQRKKKRQIQTLNTFYKVLAREMRVSRPSALAIGNFLLTQVVQRISHGEALHLIAGLPKMLHEELLRLPHGPNRKITPRLILQTLDEDFGLDTKTAFRMVRGFWSGLEYFLMGHETDHLLSQMSKELQIFFSGEKFKKRRQLAGAIIHSETTVH